MTYKISKAKVKEALIHENLTGQGWFNGNHEDDGQCGVCAIGAILRKTKPKHFDKYNAVTITDGIFSAGLVDHHFVDSNFLSRLSTEYETAKNHKQEQSDSDDMRMFLLFLTEAFCPDVLEFEV